MNLEEYRRLVKERQEIISRNRSRRLRKLPPLPVPPKPEKPKVPVAYEADGTYYGRLNNADECPKGCIVKWEDAKW